MKGVCGCENTSKLKQLLPEVQSRVFENQGCFILHYSFILHYTNEKRRISVQAVLFFINKKRKLKLRSIFFSINQAQTVIPALLPIIFCC
jgi:hypothetical protein